MTQSESDQAMLSYLAGDEAVMAAAQAIWEATGTIVAATFHSSRAQRDLEVATDSYSAAIRACRIPEEHVERLGAALILRIARDRFTARTGSDEADSPSDDA